MEAQITNIKHLPSMLENYTEFHVSESSALIRCPPPTFAREFIPWILGVDALAIKPSSEKSKYLLLLNYSDMNCNTEYLRELEDDLKISTYLFVHNLMPRDSSFPNLVLSVVPHTNGKAKGMSTAHLRRLKEVCMGKGFLAAAFAEDGDNA
jgi:hypothetical protein